MPCELLGVSMSRDHYRVPCQPVKPITLVWDDPRGGPLRVPDTVLLIKLNFNKKLVILITRRTVSGTLASSQR